MENTRLVDAMDERIAELRDELNVDHGAEPETEA
jgi:transcription initiation factor TFIIE subunit alpha